MQYHTIHDAVSFLKAKNIRITPQRQAIIEYLIDTNDHPTVEEIYRNITEKYGPMSLATVYNNLNVLVDAGLVDEMKFNGVTSRYDYNHHRHHHIICVECGRIEDVVYNDLDGLEAAAQAQTGYQVFHAKIELHGLCQDCQKKMEAEKAEKARTTGKALPNFQDSLS